MTYIKLKVPTLVQDLKVEKETQYYLSPVFFEYPMVIHLRFELAMAQYQKELKHIFKGFSVNRNNVSQLLWYTFAPELDTHRISLEFSLGKEYIKGTFLYITFEWKGYRYACLPTCDHYLFILGQAGMRADAQRRRVEQMIRHLLQQYLQTEEDFDPNHYYAGRRDFITTVEVGIYISEDVLKFARADTSWSFSSLLQSEQFNGAVELEKVGYDLNSHYPNQLDRAYYREPLVEMIYELMFRQHSPPLALVGPKGVGKSTILKEAIWRYLNGTYEETALEQMQHTWQVDPNRIISGMSIVGMWQKRFEAIIQHLRRPNDQAEAGDKMLIVNPVALLRIGRSASNNMTLSDVLKPYLEKRQLQVILLATPEEWKIVQQTDRRFGDLFQVVRIDPPDPRTTVKIILQKRRRLEAEKTVDITIQSIRQLLYIQRNFLHQQALPGSVLDLLQRLSTKYRFRSIDAEEVRQEFRAMSGLRDYVFDPSKTLRQDEVRQVLAQELIGQERAVDALNNVIHLLKAKLNDPKRPAGSFLFIGPTGVGKTQAAKVLSRYLMGDEHQMLRFDMNEYIDEGAIYRLIGDAQQPDGQLTGKVRYQPFGVLLLDEIEKAHPAVRDLLLQVLDDGRLTDSLGRTVDFTNTVIIMTSNVGAENTQRQLGFGRRRYDESVYLKAVQQQFRPEFVNRIGQVVVFNPLDLQNILRIARLQIKELLQRDGFVRRTTILNISQDALSWVARRGYDANMGGRALKRQIERDLTALSAEQLISTHTDAPILFNIVLQQDALHPEIIPLDFIAPLEEDWLPQLPQQATGRRFYRRLFNQVAALEDRVQSRKSSDGDRIIRGSDRELDWHFYHFKDRIAQIKEELQHQLLAFSERAFPGLPAIPLRLKSGTFIPRKDWSRGIREFHRDRLFQEEGLRQIGEAHQYQSDHFDMIETEFIRHFLNVAILYIHGEGFFQNRREQISLHISSCINGLGERQSAFLLNLYAQFFTLNDIHHEIDRERCSLRAEGYHLSALLQGEQGLHLFYTAHQNPLPIRLQLQVGDQPAATAYDYRVVRLFDSDQTLTDLRSGFTNAVNINPEEFKLLIFAGLAPDLRRRLLHILPA